MSKLRATMGTVAEHTKGHDAMESPKEHNPTPLARAVSAEVRAEMARHQPTITGIQLAGMIGMSQNYLAKRLRDETPLDLDDLDAISNALGVPFDVLMHRAIDGLS